MQLLTILIIVCGLAMAGCTSIGQGSQASDTPSSDTVVRDCVDHFNRLDAAIDHSALKRASQGFPICV